MNGDTNDKYQLPFYCDATSIYEFKKLILISGDIKEMAGCFDFRGQDYFDKGV